MVVVVVVRGRSNEGGAVVVLVGVKTVVSASGSVQW